MKILHVNSPSLSHKLSAIAVGVLIWRIGLNSAEPLKFSHAYVVALVISYCGLIVSIFSLIGILFPGLCGFDISESEIRWRIYPFKYGSVAMDKISEVRLKTSVELVGNITIILKSGESHSVPGNCYESRLNDVIEALEELSSNGFFRFQTEYR